MVLINAPLAVALPGELWLVAGALIWPLGAWAVVAVRDATEAPGATSSRIFGRTAVVAALVAVTLLAVSALLFMTNGSARGFQALAAQLAAGVSLVGALLCGVIAWARRRRNHATGDPQQHQERAPSE